MSIYFDNGRGNWWNFYWIKYLLEIEIEVLQSLTENNTYRKASF